MTEFYVDAAGLSGLYNQFVRASGDATDTLDYVKKHCDLSFTEVGLLMRMMSPPYHAYGQLTGALEQLRDLTQSAGTQINAAQNDYARTDQTAAARLDQSYAGAGNPASLRGTLTQGRPDLQPSRQAFAARRWCGCGGSAASGARRTGRRPWAGWRTPSCSSHVPSPRYRPIASARPVSAGRRRTGRRVGCRGRSVPVGASARQDVAGRRLDGGEQVFEPCLPGTSGSGRCRWMVPAWCARRAATLMIRVRIVAGRAQGPAARCPAVRMRVWAIAAQVSQASFAVNRLEG